VGRKKKIGLAAKPLNIRLYEQDYVEIKRLAKKLEVPDSDIHRELVNEALQARRSRARTTVPDSPDEYPVAVLQRIEAALAEVSSSATLALRDDVQTLASRIDFLTDQIAVLIQSRPSS